MQSKDDQHQVDLDQANKQIDDLKRYASHIEKRFKEVSDAEDVANRKVLTLLDEVQNLTKENQGMLQDKSSMMGVHLEETTNNPGYTHDDEYSSEEKSKIDFIDEKSGRSYEIQ